MRRLPAAACFVYGMAVVKLCRALVFEDRHLPRCETCPAPLLAAREAFIGRLEALVRWLLDEPVLDFNSVAGVATGCVLVCRLFGDASLFSVSAAINLLFLAMMLTALSSKLLGGTTHGLRSMARRLGLGSEQRALYDLRARLSHLPSETAILRAASAALQELLPRATATAVATFRPEGGDGAGEPRRSYSRGGRLAGLEAGAASAGARAALEAALTTGNSRGTSVAFACRAAGAARHLAVAWSADFPSGLNAFADWRAAARAGLAGHAVTAPLAAGPACVGFLTAQFHSAAGKEPDGDALLDSERLREFCEVVGATIFCQRAAHALEASQSIVNDIYPPNVARQLERRARESTPDGNAPQGSAEAEAAAAGARASIAEDAEESEDGAPLAAPRLPRSASSGRLSLRMLGAENTRASSQLFAEAFPSVTIVFAGACVHA
jgi:hypothetical protein